MLEALDAVVHQAELKASLSGKGVRQSAPQLVGVQCVARGVLQLAEQMSERTENAGGRRRGAVVAGEQIDRVSEVVQMPKYLK